MSVLVTPEPAKTATSAPAGRPTRRPRALRLLNLPTGWPLVALLVFFPLWWALGLGTFIFPILAVPMAWQLLRRRSLRVPAYFGVWALFLVWVAAGVVMLNSAAPNTLQDSGGLLGYVLRLVNYLAATVTLLYVGNLSEKEMSRTRIVGMLGWFFVVTVAGGLLGTLFPYLEFTSPFEMLLPQSLRANFYVQTLVHPAAAQVQTVLGYAAPRPKAPFEYTNFWGENISVLLVWFLVWCWLRPGTRRRWLAALVIGVAVVPIVYSLNRGLWIGIGLSLLYLALRLAAHGRLGALASIVAVVAVAGVMFVASPLHGVIQERLDHPQSNDIRASLNLQAVEAATHSPVLGWGSTRSAIGSPQSVAVGKQADCPQCGNAPIGSTGQLWLLLISNGFVGAALYVGFLCLSIFRYRRDRSPVGMAGSLVLCLTLFYGLFYDALPSMLTLCFISLALLWRQDARRRPASDLTGLLGEK